MHRRQFLSTATATTLAANLGPRLASAAPRTGPGFASPAEAMQAEPEKLLYTVGIYRGTQVRKPDFLATIDADPKSPTYAQVIHRLPMTHMGDELHHFGWNACSSCHFDPSRSRRHMIVPGLKSSRIYVIDTHKLREPKLHKIIEPEEIKTKTNLSAPHTVHCLADGTILLSMLGDAQGRAPGGFLLLDDRFEIVGRWEKSLRSTESGTRMRFNYDYWYQPRHNVMVSTEWAAPNTYWQGFDPKAVEAGKFGRHLNFWDWKERQLVQSFDLGNEGRIPLEVRFHHNPESTHGFVGATLSSNIWHWYKPQDEWMLENIISVPAAEKQGWPFPVPGLITDILISMDDRFLYFSNWLHGDVRQYDISNPSKPKLTGQVWLGGVLGRTDRVAGRKVTGGPQMLQLSLDGKRLYVTSSLLSKWDNQFYPGIAERGSFLVKLDCNTKDGGMELDERFFVDFGAEPNGPARAHEVRYPGGDCSSDVFV